MATRKKPAGCCELKTVRRLPRSFGQQIVAAMKALADPTRLEILRTLAAQTGPVCACDIVDRFDLSQPTISHHLKTLRKGGLLTGRRQGLWTFYAPDPQGMALLADLGRIVADR